MIKQMERKFTLVSISAISLVLLVLILLVNIVSINGNIQRADGSLDRLVLAEEFDKSLPKPEEDTPSDLLSLIKDRRDFGKEDNRSFEVVLSNELKLVTTDSNEKNMQDEDTAYQMALIAVGENKEYGFIEDFRYKVVMTKDGAKVLFLDYSFEKQSEIYFMIVSAGAYLLSILLVSLLVHILLKPVMKSIKESYAKQKQFITDASHELKTPLTVISTDMQIIEMEHGSSEWITSVNQQITRLNTLTNELVSLTRMDEEETQMIMGQVNLSDIVNDVVMGFEPAIIAKEKTFKVKVEDDLLLKGNDDSLERVMSVLLSNALKYSEDKGLIEVKAFRKGKKINIVVMNTTDLISIGSHDEFFERFYRSDASRNSKTGGSGIGLAIAKAIVEEHNGRIEAKSNTQNSLTITITLKAS